MRAVVITGAGRGFCVGQDLQEFSSGAGDVADNLRENYHRNVLAIRALEKPVIAAVNGPAAGAGMSLALACDVRIAADEASFVPAFINIGLVPDSGGTWLVRRLLGDRARVRVADDGPPARRGRGARRGARLRGRSGRRARAPHARGRGALRGDADARRLATRSACSTRRRATFDEQLELEAVTQAEMTQTHDFRRASQHSSRSGEAEFTGADARAAAPDHGQRRTTTGAAGD